MTPTKTMRLVQDDLFGAPPTLVATIAQRDERAPAKKRRPRQHATTSLEANAARERSPRMGTVDQIVLAEIKGAHIHGRTRDEIAARTGLKLQTVCGAANRLVKAGHAWEPTVSYDGNGRPQKWARDGKKILVDPLYQQDWDITSAVKRIA